MANPEYSDFDYDHGADTATVRPGMAMALLGAGASVALMAGVAWWAYDLAVRNVNGLPVISAVDGPARVAPEDPGGFQAEHQGLAVTSVSSREAPPAPDQVMLAPEPIDLAPADQPIGQLEDQARDAIMRDAVGRAVQDAQLDGATDPTVPIITPEEDLTIDTPTETQLAEARAIPRPVQRPNTPQVTRSAPRATEPLALPVDLDPATLPSGTRLVQLGAYDSATTAQAQWDLISARFEPYFQNRQRVIQRANVGGRTFYRLRVHGFKNRAEADRFCAALQAQNTDCIPALVR